MKKDDPDKQPVSWATVIIAAVLVFLALNYAAGFDLWLSVAVALAVGAIAVVLRRRMSAGK